MSRLSPSTIDPATWSSRSLHHTGRSNGTPLSATASTLKPASCHWARELKLRASSLPAAQQSRTSKFRTKVSQTFAGVCAKLLTGHVFDGDRDATVTQAFIQGQAFVHNVCIPTLTRVFQLDQHISLGTFTVVVQHRSQNSRTDAGIDKYQESGTHSHR